jgi:small-conductance mechanosensitive channel/CRP-like cAMP-binding protein
VTTFALPAGLVLAMSAMWLWLRFRPSSWQLAGTFVAWGLLSVVLIRAEVSPLLTGALVPRGPEGHWLRAVGIFWWLCNARILAGLARWVLARGAATRRSGIAGDLVSGLIYLATFLVVLNFVLMLPVGGLVATSGVVAVVIGLALQNTLADVFSGIAVGIEGPFTTGDRITLADGTEGVVVEINWRSIRIQTDGGDIAVVPNGNVAKALVINQSLPTQRRAVRVLVVQPASALPASVNETLRRAAIFTPGVLAAPAPIVGLTRLGMRSATYAIDFYVADASAAGRSRSGVLEEVHRQLRLAEMAVQLVGKDSREAGRMLLGEMPVFAGLSDEQRDAVSTRLQRRQVKSGAIVFAKDGEADSLILIADGVIAITGASPETASPVLRFAGSSEAIGDIALLAGERRPFTARADTDSTLFTMSREDLLALVSQDEGLAEALETSATAHQDILRRVRAADEMPTHQLPHIFEAFRRRLHQATALPPDASG